MGEHQFDEVGGEPPVPLVDRYRSCTSEDLASVFAELGGGARALDAQRLAILAVLDEREAWKGDGARDTAGWVAGVDALRRGTARSVVDVARALVDLPAIAAVAAEGRLSFDQLRPLCTLATPDTDARWAEQGPGLEAGQLGAEAAKATRKSREAAQEQEAKRNLTIWRARGGGTRFAGYLPDVDAETLTAGLDRLATRYQPAPGDPWEPLQVRRADALVELASVSLADTSVGATAHIYIHAHAGAFGEDANGWVTLADGTSIARQTRERLGCDATTQLVLHDATGAFTALGAATHAVPRRIRRLLATRDRCCRFPGCEATLGLHAHHIRFWSRNGKTEVWNLALVCHRHHKLIHEGGWTLTGDPDNPVGLTFTSPHGRVVTTQPAPCSDRVRQRLVPDPPPGPQPDPAEEPTAADRHASCAHHAQRSHCTHLDALRARLRRDLLRDLADEGP